METDILHHRTEPVLDLGRQAKEAGEVFISRESDDHPSSLT
ncbi:hypothetical protein [Streptomyces sp. NPDC088115]